MSINRKNNTFIRFLSFLLALSFIFTTLFLFSPKNLSAESLRELNNQIASLSSEEQELLEKIMVTSASIDQKRAEIENITATIENIKYELIELNNQRNSLEISMNEKREVLAERIVHTYKYGSNEIARYIISAKDINEVVNNLYLFVNIMKRDAELIEELRYEKEEYDRILRKSEEKKKELEQSKEMRLLEEKELEKALARDQALRESKLAEKEEVQSALAAMEARIRAIQPEGVVITGEEEMVATAYYAFGKGGNDINGNGITATGLQAGKGIVAVDPSFIPLGTRLFIEGYGIALAADTGGWIKGNRIDLCFNTLEECFRYGRRRIYVYPIQ
jgi:3D (Asp-Asp-Asp) domain-containing protein/peptidoglycan hydrolase CwlO-like protein